MTVLATNSVENQGMMVLRQTGTKQGRVAMRIMTTGSIWADEAEGLDGSWGRYSLAKMTADREFGREMGTRDRDRAMATQVRATASDETRCWREGAQVWRPGDEAEEDQPRWGRKIRGMETGMRPLCQEAGVDLGNAAQRLKPARGDQRPMAAICPKPARVQREL